MLQPHNVGYASTCNSVGQTAGYFLGYVFYIGLESYGLVTLSSFLFFWSGIFVVATTLVAVFKHEDNKEGHHHHDGEEELELGVVETYSMLWKIMTLPLMPAFIALLLTQKVIILIFLFMTRDYYFCTVISRLVSPRLTALLV